MVFRIHPTVRQALKAGGAVVALESTVITHGLPRPQNLELARRLETVVKEAGAVPATVGLIEGEVVVGLDEAELDLLANSRADKASLWNLPGLAAGRQHAGTTVAATLHAAHRAGIKVFATGGIGGVHRQAFDESSDLTALARYRVVVVCAGPKSVLDVPATLERLETMGVPVVGYRSGRLAGFHVPETEYELPLRCDSPEAVANCFASQEALGYQAALLVSNPVSEGLEPEQVRTWIAQAQSEAAEQGLSGKDVTPYLLARLAERSNGRTVTVNLRLLEENARLAAEIARALASERQAARTAQV